jgi:hypothetical protein
MDLLTKEGMTIMRQWHGGAYYFKISSERASTKRIPEFRQPWTLTEEAMLWMDVVIRSLPMKHCGSKSASMALLSSIYTETRFRTHQAIKQWIEPNGIEKDMTAANASAEHSRTSHAQQHGLNPSTQITIAKDPKYPTTAFESTALQKKDFFF